MSLIDKVLELCAYDDEQEWFEFKENWFQAEELGEYVSAQAVHVIWTTGNKWNQIRTNDPNKKS